MLEGLRLQCITDDDDDSADACPRPLKHWKARIGADIVAEIVPICILMMMEGSIEQTPGFGVMVLSIGSVDNEKESGDMQRKRMRLPSSGSHRAHRGRTRGNATATCTWQSAAVHRRMPLSSLYVSRLQGETVEPKVGRRGHGQK